ncbi:hypothetical protein HELRODRAFT_158627 [Helobdella robusta]|uniref:Uncharacterized protein n=1 Tax=Helobdella robusta TaxID=6412 RepID=T1EN13_HELRO|nr:hypothetical protein HELRODRAFT_158627 [Helobdella robusta]ESO12163.1 hypothetical protein HELRODRAFT_158627 [Helobdella robusta]
MQLTSFPFSFSSSTLWELEIDDEKLPSCKKGILDLRQCNDLTTETPELVAARYESLLRLLENKIRPRRIIILSLRSSMNFENRWVLRSALNFASDGEIVREVGREFQRKGPEKAKADLAKECLTRVKKKREEEDDRKPGRLEGLSLRHIESDQAIIEERHRDKL